MNSALYPNVVVNGELVPHTQVAAETQNQEAPKGKPGIAWRKAANAIAIRTLLLQEAQSRAITAEPQEVGPGRFETEDEARIRALLEEAVETSPPRDAEIRAEWEKTPDRFRAPPLWEVSHILFACDPRDDKGRSEAHARAKAAASVLARDPKAFAALAKRESECSSGTSGGALGQLGPGDTVPEFEAVLRDLRELEITSKPVLTRHGYHLIRLDALAQGRVLPFEAVRGKISDALEKSAWTQQARKFVDDLVKAAKIEGVDFSKI